MSYTVTQEDVRLLLQQSKKLSVTFELLNQNMQIIDELQGDIISGDYSEDSTSDIRKTLNVTFYVRNKSYYINENSNIWMDKTVRVKLGILNNRTGKIVQYNLGLFIFSDYNFNYDSTNNTLTLPCIDLMGNFTGLRKGKLDGLKTVIDTKKGRNIRDVMISTITQLGGIKNYLIDNIGSEYPHNLNPETNTYPEQIPYDLEFSTGSTIYDILVKLRDLYPGYQMYFDVDGTFICTRIPTAINDIAILDDTTLSSLIISEAQSGSFNNIKNCIQVFGKDNSYWTIKLVNAIPSVQTEKTTYKVNPESPYTIEKIGEVWEVFSGGEYEKIYTEQLLKDRCAYELWNATNRTIALTLESILIPFLNVYQKIKYTLKSSKETYQFITNKISFNLTDGKMSIGLNRFYPLYEWM
ncbi:MAG: DUF5048 domain-containing protein [Oscillospiraceae bacterium]